METTSAWVTGLQEEVAEGAGKAEVSTLTALLGVARNMFPENIAVAAVDMNILGEAVPSKAFSSSVSMVVVTSPGLF